MIANLPLLFANGNPTALSKISAGELEKFITFMVTCSWGHDTAKDIRQPPWWPHDVAFSHPFARPPDVPKDWDMRLKNVVKKCYEFHKSAFLLVFSAHLARYPRNRLRYVDNRDHTTSLYYRPNGRLLVTFRNENIYYDRGAHKDVDEPLVKAADIYLCDNCDSHFDNLDLLKAHERLCNSEEEQTSTCSTALQDLLSALRLQRVGEEREEPVPLPYDDGDTKPKNARNASNIDRGPPYPFSSLAYMKNAKAPVQRDMTYVRERIERFCCTSTPLSKNVVSKSKNHQFPVRYRRPIDYWHRKHVFPSQRKKRILDLKAQLLLLKCRPLKVRVERMSLDKIFEYIDNLKKESEHKVLIQTEEKDIIFVDNVDCEQPNEEEMKYTDPLKKVEECEVIDLCSDDETPSVNENCDPRGAVTCVMRGGAVLRRTVPPSPLGAQPCSVRQRPLPPAVLQPHPVILIAHTLNNLQTISID